MNTTQAPSFRRTFAPALGLFLALAGTSPGRTQGCSQCREAVGQTPPRTQTAYRKAILLLISAGAVVFAGGVAAVRRFR